MAAQSITTIYIGGKEIKSFKRLVLQQSINNHHTLQIECHTSAIENVLGEFVSETKNYLGEEITVEITSKDILSQKKPLEFFGVVTSVRSSKGYLDSNVVRITASSPTIIADDGPHYHSYVERDLNYIVDNTLSNYDAKKLNTTVQAKYTSPIPYAVQHKESNWQFLSRLAVQYGEWLYYDGKNMIFGVPESAEPVELVHNFDLKEFALNLTPVPNKFNYFTNDYITDEHHTKKASDINTGSNGHHKFMSDKADMLYAAETNVWVNNGSSNQLKAMLDNQIDLQKKTAEQGQVLIEGTSDNPGVSLGKIISIKGKLQDYGEYRVAQISHQQDYLGNYSNTFSAYSTELDVFPDTNFEAFPYSDTQTAIVMENSDPDGMARVKVQFPWQKFTGQTTPWIRVVTPHGGGDKGFHFIPEKGEEVLVGFEGGNAERPYMMGSLYHGKAAANGFKSDANDIKAIQSRSGNKVIMNDKDGSITVADPSGNVIVMQGNGEIVIQAPNKLTLASKDINIMAGNSINIIAKPNEEGGGDGTMSIYAQRDLGIHVADEGIGIKANKDITITSETASANLNAKTDANIKGETSVNLDGDKLNITGGSKIKIESSDTDIL